MPESPSKLDLYFRETIGLLKKIVEDQATQSEQIAEKLELINQKDLSVNVESPNVEVTPSPISEVKVLNLSDLSLTFKNLADVIRIAQEKGLNEVRIKNLGDLKIDSVNVKNVGEITKLLEKILKKDQNIQIKQEGAKVTFPIGGKPSEYIPVRLTNGREFINAIGSVISGGAIDPAKSVSFYADMDLTTDISKIGSNTVIVETDGDKTLTTTINGSHIEERWS